MSYFKEIEFDRDFGPDLHGLRKNRQLLAYIKADIKKRSKNQTIWKNDYKDVQRRKKLWSTMDNSKCTPTTLMRHIFLAYAWLRFKPLWKVEPNTKDVRSESVSLLGKYYQFSPSPDLMRNVIYWYAKRAAIDLKTEEEEEIVQIEEPRWGVQGRRVV